MLLFDEDRNVVQGLFELQKNPSSERLLHEDGSPRAGMAQKGLGM